jgi:transposase
MAELLRRLAPEVGEVGQAQQLALSFVEVIKEQRADELRGWIIAARRSEIPEFVGFANGLAADLQAVRAALEYAWSQGQTEGQVASAEVGQETDVRAR